VQIKMRYEDDIEKIVLSLYSFQARDFMSVLIVFVDFYNITFALVALFMTKGLL